MDDLYIAIELLHGLHIFALYAFLLYVCVTHSERKSLWERELRRIAQQTGTHAS